MAPTRLIARIPPSILLLFLLPCVSRAADDGTWSRFPADSTSDPSVRRECVAIYDEPRDRFLVFGGANQYAPNPASLIDETRALDFGSAPGWSWVNAHGPGARHTPQMGYDPANQRMLIFGGYGYHLPTSWTADYLYDVWELALDGSPTWSELVASGTHPTGRLAGASIYDPMRQRFVVFGGTVGATVDVYALDLSSAPAWSVLPVDGTPPIAGYGMTTIYDPRRDRMIMFGGSISDDYFGVQDKVWALTFGDHPTWTEITPAADGPCARRSLVSIYDPVRDRMVIFGGWDNLSNDQSSFLGDVWALSLEGTPHWTELHPTGGAAPVGRDIPSAAYDSKRDRFVLFAGFDGLNFLNDTWFLNWGHTGDAALLAPNASVQSGVAQITWDVTSATADHAAVFRRQENTPWQSVAVVHQNVAGDVVYNDASVVPGQRYAYLAAVPSEQGTNFGGEIWVDVPSTVDVEPSLGFSLQGAVPNPAARRDLNVTFSLPIAARAVLSLRDVNGRIVAWREVGSLGAGGHSIAFAHDRELAAGVYFLTLEQGDLRATRRIVLF